MTRRRQRHRDAQEDFSAIEYSGFRTARLEELIREEVGSVLRDEVRDPRLAGIEITMVELSRDGSRARLWYTCTEDGDSKAIEHALSGASRFIRLRLAEALPLKRVPDVRFRHDPCAYATELKPGEKP